MTKNVGDILAPGLRRVLYIVFAVIGVVFGATQTAFVTAEVAAPIWLTVAFQVYLYVGGAFGLVAATNTTTPTAQVVGAEGVGEEDSTVAVEPSVMYVGNLGTVAKHAAE